MQSKNQSIFSDYRTVILDNGDPSDQNKQDKG